MQDSHLQGRDAVPTSIGDLLDCNRPWKPSLLQLQGLELGHGSDERKVSSRRSCSRYFSC